MHTKGDFHLHTIASDGKLSAEKLIDIAKAQNLDIIAITDHDTVGSVASAIEYGKNQGIRVLPGIELSTIYYGESIHILGYFKDESYKKKEFTEVLSEMIDYRENRAKKIVNNLDRYFDIKLDYENVLKNAKGVVARPHIAKAIIEAGYDYSWEHIFHNIIDESSPAYVPKKNLSIEEGIALLRQVNAVVVLAHPVLIQKSSIDELMKFDFDGIEAIYHKNTPEQTEYFKEIAKKYNKIITAGSDFHGIGEGDKGHGTVGCVYLTDENLNIFLEKLDK